MDPTLQDQPVLQVCHQPTELRTSISRAVRRED
ncbi:Protein of unknown function [Gryllus bimaculatus]|nr:Protein of unknown function [Gryllus bimaculatus]